MSDPTKTNPETPTARQSSGSLDLKLQDCPACERDGYSKTCRLCGGGKKVTGGSARDWKRREMMGELADEEIPDTLPGT